MAYKYSFFWPTDYDEKLRDKNEDLDLIQLLEKYKGKRIKESSLYGKHPFDCTYLREKGLRLVAFEYITNFDHTEYIRSNITTGLICIAISAVLSIGTYDYWSLFTHFYGAAFLLIPMFFFTGIDDFKTAWREHKLPYRDFVAFYIVQSIPYDFYDFKEKKIIETLTIIKKTGGKSNVKNMHNPNYSLKNYALDWWGYSDDMNEISELSEIHSLEKEWREKRRQSNHLDDDAHFLSYGEISELGLASRKGIPVGHFRNYPIPLHYAGERHLITIAPNGSGKHACVQAPVLLECNNSVFIIDPKGENAAVTARYRRDSLGQKVHILNPFGVHRSHFENLGFQSARFNPLAALNPASPNFAAEVGAICETLIVTEGKEPFFDNSARGLVASLIMHVCTFEGEIASLGRVREILASDNLLRAVLLTAEKSDFQSLRQKAGTFIKDREAADLGVNKSVLDSARTQTEFLDDPAIADNLSDSSFSMEQLKKERKHLTEPHSN